MSRKLGIELSHYAWARKFGVGAATLLASLLLVAVCCPIVNSDVNATSGIANNTTSSGLNSTISVAVGDNVGLPITFEADGTDFVTGSTSITINGTNISGYTVNMSTADGTSNLNPQAEGVGQVIGAPNDTLSITNYRNNLNTWGYSLTTSTPTGATTYKPVPGSITEVDSVSFGNELVDRSRNYSLNFALSADSSLPAGEYSNNVMISVVAEPAKPTMDDITYMQQMAPYYCANSDLDKTYTLTDSRNGTKYNVKKMADGNCWMLQNLALRIVPSGLKAIDTDIEVDWDDSANENYKPELTYSTINSSTTKYSSSQVRSWNNNNGYGTYYTWCAATAGTCQGVTDDGVVASGSICPKGWKLPLSGNEQDSNNTVNGSFYNLLSGYGLANEDAFSSVQGTYDVYLKDGSKITKEVYDGEFNLQDISFDALGGEVYLGENGGGLSDVRTGATWISSVAVDQFAAYTFMIYRDSHVISSPSYGKGIDYGMFVRCLAR